MMSEGIGMHNQPARIGPAAQDKIEPSTQAVLDGQARKWGAPLVNHMIYARRPSIFRGVRAMWSGLGGSGLIPGQMQALVNRRVAALNGCEF